MPATTAPTYRAYAKTPAGRFEVFPVTRVAGKLTRGATVQTYATVEAAETHCAFHNAPLTIGAAA